MGLLPDHRRRFIKSLSELRNDLVDDVSRSGFSFASYIDSLDSNRRREFGRAFSWKIRPRDQAPKDDWTENALSNPQLAVWMNLLLLLIDVSRKRSQFEEFMGEHDLP
jgi:hypothetical protein